MAPSCTRVQWVLSFVAMKEPSISSPTSAPHKDDEIRQHPRVCLAFANTRSQKYLSVSGTGEILNDREKIRELWAIPAKVWWKTPENPNLRLIKVTPVEAEYWDAPGNVISDLRVVFALVTGGYPRLGNHKKVPI